MAVIEIKVPMLPESVADATVLTWHKKPGDLVERDENIVELETDKVVLEVPAPEAGILVAIEKPEGTNVVADEILASLKPGAVAIEKKAVVEKPVANPELAAEVENLSPAVRRLVSEHNVDTARIAATGKSGCDQLC